jgi:hypothetical protein
MKRNTIVSVYSFVITTILLFAVITTVKNINAAESFYNYDEEEAKKQTYTDYEGKTIDYNTYMNRLGICVDMKVDRFIPQLVDCEEWILSKYFEKVATDYVITREMIPDKLERFKYDLP